MWLPPYHNQLAFKLYNLNKCWGGKGGSEYPESQENWVVTWDEKLEKMSWEPPQHWACIADEHKHIENSKHISEREYASCLCHRGSKGEKDEDFFNPNCFQ